ncbi:MAG: hypothetical protein QOF44_4409 [Streptomyces sp.]|jgi:hypothetical protein|nr:hypothetical protein [Streptomyces sp.]
MRISNLAATAIAASLAGSLTLGVAGIAGATVHAPTRVSVVADAHADAAAVATPAADVIAKLGDTLTYGAKLSQEAMAQAPDVSKIQELQRSLKAAADQLTTSLGQAATTKPAADKPAADKPAADMPAMPADKPADATKGLGHRDATPIDDAMAKVNDQLKTLTTDVTELVAAVGNKDVAKVTTLVPKILGDLTALTTSIPTILTSLLGGVLPIPLPIALDNDPNQQSAPAAPEAPQAPAAPDAPQAPQLNAPENADTPQAPQAPEVPQAPAAPQDQQAPAAPQAPAADPQAPAAPAAPVVAPQLNAPQIAETAESTG